MLALPQNQEANSNTPYLSPEQQQLVRAVYSLWQQGNSTEAILEFAQGNLSRQNCAVVRLFLNHLASTYQPSELEIAAFKAQLYEDYRNGTNSEEFYQRAEQENNPIYKQLLIQSAQIIQKAEAIGRIPASTAANTPQLANLAETLEEATGLYVSGDPGSGKTSAINHLIGLATNVLGAAEILVFDTHWFPGKWEGMTVIYEPELVLNQMRFMLDGNSSTESELQRSKDAKRTGQNCPLRIWIIDELGDLSLHAKRQFEKNKEARWKHLIGDFLVGFGSQGRKYEYFGVAINQATNVASSGLDGMGDYLEAFVKVFTGRIAGKWAKIQGLNKGAIEFLTKQAYPCLIGDTPAIHPTHGNYRVRKKKQPPKPEQDYPVQQLPLSIQLVMPPDSEGEGWVAGDISARAFAQHSQQKDFQVKEQDKTNDEDLYQLFIDIKTKRSQGLTKTQIAEGWDGNNQDNFNQYERAIARYAGEWITDFIENNQLTARWQDLIELIWSATPHKRHKQRFKEAKKQLGAILAELEVVCDWRKN